MTNSFITSKLVKSGDHKEGRLQIETFEKAYLASCGRPISWHQKAAKRLISIFGNSSALAEKLIRNPSWADILINDPAWNKRKSINELNSELQSQIREINTGDIEAFKKALRHFKYRHMIRIVARDLDASPSVNEILGEWSDVADAIIAATYDAALKIAGSQFGSPMWKLDGGQLEPCSGMVIALGKLGSRELNMSSDIDLLCLYESDDGETLGGLSGKLTNHEFFTKVISLLTKILSQVTEDGFVFRCDHDLRPEGPKGPLVNSVLAAERYYEIFGQDWERQMLIRARPIAGDISLGEAFIEYISPFVYRRSLSLGDLTHLKEMKEKIETKTLKESYAENVKLGRGGIRELEFLVQGFQQVFGGHIKKIRTPNTFEAIDALMNCHLIHPHGARIIKESYAFMRRLENMIQIHLDTQTYELPQTIEGLGALARRMGPYDEESLISEWRRHSTSIHRLFAGLFKKDYEKLELKEAMNANLITCNSEEEKADSLPWFKRQETKRLVRLDLEGKIVLPDLLKALTLTAEVVIQTARRLAVDSLISRFGEPLHEDSSPALFTIMGFGRLGSREIDYGSDLDLCFLYSGEGKTTGPNIISNQEFFTRVSQRIISLISINSRYGRAYIIDSELRPSGHQGSLVATLNSFSHYHTHKSQLWERFALLKARAIVGDDNFIDAVRSALLELAYKKSAPSKENIKEEIKILRQRFEEEAANEKEGVYNLKIGYGGNTDIEQIMQFLQLTNSNDHASLQIQNGFEIIKNLHELSILDENTYETINSAYYFNRSLMAKLRLFTRSATDLLDFAAPYIEPISKLLGFSTPKSLKDKFEEQRRQTRRLFLGFFS